MAVTGAVYSYNQKTIKEDITDIIYNIDPFDTPALSGMKTVPLNNTLFSWNEDVLAAPAANASEEGADGDDGGHQVVDLISNNTQIFKKLVKVTGTSESVDFYGRKSEKAYQLAKKSKELKRDIEFALVGRPGGDVQTPTAHSTGVGGLTGSVQYFIDASVTKGNHAIPSAYTVGSAFEADILATHQALFEAGSDATQLQIAPGTSINVAALTRASARTRDYRNEKTLTNVVELYVSPFGELHVVINRWLFAADMLFMDFSYLNMGYLRNPRKEELAKVGDSSRCQVIAEGGVKVLNKKATGLLAGVTFNASYDPTL